jgi:hypothetical protein
VSLLKFLVVAGIIGISLLFAGLTIGAFAHGNPDVRALPPGVEFVRAGEGWTAERIGFLSTPTIEAQAFGRGFAYMGLAIILTGIASALVAETTSQTLPRPGRRGA